MGKRDGPLTKDEVHDFWIMARRAAGRVADARLHDPRHAHAPHTVMNGESLHVAKRSLGLRRASTTNCYVRLNNTNLSQAAERVAAAIQGKLKTAQRPPMGSSTDTLDAAMGRDCGRLR